MTKEELIQAIDSGYIVNCTCTEERNAVLKYLKKCGYIISDASSRYFEQGNLSAQHLCPGLASTGMEISCHRSSALYHREYLDYTEIIDLIDPPLQVDIPDSEFYGAVMNLFAG